MEYSKVIKALNSKTRQEIVSVQDDNHYILKEIYEKILEENLLEKKHRATIYRALEILVDADLVDKYYVKEKGICYRLKIKCIEIDVINKLIKPM